VSSVGDLPAGLALFPATKFAGPPTRAEYIARRRCLARLEGPPRPDHVLICAPAGSGKSTLAAQAIDRSARRAWVSLAPEDDEPGQLFGALVLGLRHAIPGFGEPALVALRSGAEVRMVVGSICDELLELEEDVAVVLDDVHVIHSEECWEGVAALLEYAPPNTRLVLCSRRMPPFGVERLEVRGKLATLRAADLRFDEDETREFLSDRLDLELNTEQFRELYDRTDGWAAGLYLASLSLHGGVPIDELIDAIDAGDRRITGYFVAEALRSEDPKRLEFLERVAVLGRFTAALCDAVLGRADSASMIAELERSNLFVIPLDATGTSFRLHHLFAELLERRLSDREPDTFTQLHAAAGAWHRDHGELPEAIEHLLSARCHDAAAELIARSHAAYTTISRRGAVTARWLARLPTGVIERSVPLSIVSAWVAAVNGRRAEVEEHLAHACELPWEGRLPDGSVSPQAQAALLRASVPFGDAGAALRHAREAASLANPSSPWWPLIEQVVGLWQYVKEGPSEEAADWLLRASRDGAMSPMVITRVLAPAQAAGVVLELGRPEQAAELCAQSAELHGALRPAMVTAAHAYSFRARVLRHLGRLEEAELEARAGLRHVSGLPEDADPNFAIPVAQIEAARVLIATGALGDAHEHLMAARARLERAKDPGHISDWLAAAEGALVAAGERPPGTVSLGRGASLDLSERELAVLRMLAGPLSLREIGSELFISHNTIKTHVRSIYRKLDVDGRADAVRLARLMAVIP
jgi:LuxR family maltose regulon positive regulatory protein